MNRNAQDDAWQGLEPTELEMSLEQELRELQPWRPSAHLRQRIEAEAAAARREPELRTAESLPDQTIRRFPSLPFGHALAAVAAAAALVAIAVVPHWVPAAKETALAAGKAAEEQPESASAETESPDLILWDRIPGVDTPADWHRDQILIGSESMGVVEPVKGPAMLRVRYQLLNRTSWKDQKTGAMREQFTPEERVLFVPVRHH